MADYIFIPFSGFDDMDTTIKESIRSAESAKVPVLYSGERGRVTTGDRVCVHAHGSAENTTIYARSRGGKTKTMSDVITELVSLGTGSARECRFFICFSANVAHIAPKWKETHQGQDVYGINSTADGALYSFTRSGTVYHDIFSSAQLFKL